MLDPATWYTIKQLGEEWGGSDRLYRDEIAEGRLEAVFTGEWRILGSDALAWAQERAVRRQARRGRRGRSLLSLSVDAERVVDER